MKCPWTQLLGILPQSMRGDVDKLGKDSLQELRLRLGKPGEMVMGSGCRYLQGNVTAEELHYVVNTASRYSPWAAATAAQGFITAAGGHRIGLCGQCTYQEGRVTGIRDVTSLCIRVARDFVGLATGIPLIGSVLVLGPPGSGKTTLLRDLIRRVANENNGSVAVVDERGELFPKEAGFLQGKRMDILTGCDKKSGIEMTLRTMGPSWIAVDEVTSRGDCEGLIQAGWCGVRLVASAHAAGKQDLLTRPVYRPLVESGLFDTLVILRPDKSWTYERMRL